MTTAIATIEAAFTACKLVSTIDAIEGEKVTAIASTESDGIHVRYKAGKQIKEVCVPIINGDIQAKTVAFGALPINAIKLAYAECHSIVKDDERGGINKLVAPLLDNIRKAETAYAAMYSTKENTTTKCRIARDKDGNTLGVNIQIRERKQSAAEIKAIIELERKHADEMAAKDAELDAKIAEAVAKAIAAK